MAVQNQPGRAELWARFAAAAVTRSDPDTAAIYADSMLREFDKRFESGGYGNYWTTRQPQKKK